MQLKRIPRLFVIYFVLLTSCTQDIGVFEKDISLPGQEWESSFKPQIIFSVSDTSSLYNIYLVFRHTDAYNYNNIWIRAIVQEPGDPKPKSRQYDLTLATNDKGWLGSGMDDIYEQRVLIQAETKFNRIGDYHFTLEQIMREDPLLHVLDAGLRVEKIR
jgi:gliding motility-associated lipoprotein GldH